MKTLERETPTLGEWVVCVASMLALVAILLGPPVIFAIVVGTLLGL